MTKMNRTSRRDAWIGRPKNESGRPKNDRCLEQSQNENPARKGERRAGPRNPHGVGGMEG
jgi:hypothetical protein